MNYLSKTIAAILTISTLLGVHPLCSKAQEYQEPNGKMIHLILDNSSAAEISINGHSAKSIMSSALQVIDATENSHPPISTYTLGHSTAKNQNEACYPRPQLLRFEESGEVIQKEYTKQQADGSRSLHNALKEAEQEIKLYPKAQHNIMIMTTGGELCSKNHELVQYLESLKRLYNITTDVIVINGAGDNTNLKTISDTIAVAKSKEEAKKALTTIMKKKSTTTLPKRELEVTSKVGITTELGAKDYSRPFQVIPEQQEEKNNNNTKRRNSQ